GESLRAADSVAAPRLGKQAFQHMNHLLADRPSVAVAADPAHRRSCLARAVPGLDFRQRQWAGSMVAVGIFVAAAGSLGQDAQRDFGSSGSHRWYLHEEVGQGDVFLPPRSYISGAGGGGVWGLAYRAGWPDLPFVTRRRSPVCTAVEATLASVLGAGFGSTG